MTEHQEDFEKIVRDAGIPTTEADMQAQWNQINDEQGVQIKNDSSWSPFWKLVSALITAPALWVVQFLLNELLPNSFIKTAGGTFLEILAWGLKITRKPAVNTQGVITFTRDQIADAVIVPAGTRIQSPAINGTVYELVTLADTSFPDGQLTVNVLAEAIEAGAAWNLAPGYYSILPEPVEGVVSVRNPDDWISTAGDDAETDEALKLRCRNQFTAVSQFHHDAAYRAIIAEFTAIRVDYIWFEHNAPRGEGTANAFIMIDSGAPDQPFVDGINTHINDNGFHGHGDDMQCFPMPVTGYDLTPDAYLSPNLTTEEQDKLMLDINNMIRCAFRENSDYTVTKTWPFSRFSFSKLSEELHTQWPGLISIEFNRVDIENAMELPVISTLTITKHLAVSGVAA